MATRTAAVPLVWLWLAVLASAVGLTIAIAAGWTPDETDAVREVQSWSFPGQPLSDAVRAVTSTEVVVLVGIPIVALHWRAGDRRAAAILIVLLVVMPATQAGMKELVDRPRPSDVAPGIQVRGSQTSRSFPSGHVMGATVVYGWAAVALLRPRSSRPAAAQPRAGNSARDAGGEPRQRLWGGGAESAVIEWSRLLGAAVLIAVIVLTAPVNVYLGVHWPTDTLGGYLWGAALLLPALAVYSGADA
jgi:undecaprenyl-diphosphatase